MKKIRVLAALMACCLLLTSMATSNYEKAIYHQGKAEQAYKYSLVSMMKAHLDSMEEEIAEMDLDTYLKNDVRLNRGYYKLVGDYYYLIDDLESALHYYNLAQPMFDRYDSTGYYAIIHEEKAQLYYKMKKWDMAKSHADTLKSLYNDSIDYKNGDKTIYWSSVSDLCLAREAVDYYKLGFTHEAENKFNNSLSDINTLLGVLMPSDGDIYYDVLRTRAKILMLKSEQDGSYNDQSRKDFGAYFERKKSQIGGTLLGMSEAQREEFWMKERQFITDCYRLEDHAPELLYDVTLFAKGILLHLGKNGIENHEKLSFTTYKDVQKALPSNSCAIEFIQYERDGDQHLAALVLHKKGTPEFNYIGKVGGILDTQISTGYHSTMTIRQIIDEVNTGERSSSNYDFLYNDSTWYNLIWTPELMSRIKDYDRVYFAPEGFLRAVAIEYALPSGYEGLDLYRLSSTNVLTSQKARVDRNKLYKGSALIMGLGKFGDTCCVIPDNNQGIGDNDTIAYKYLIKKIWFGGLKFVKYECDTILNVRRNLGDLYLKDFDATEKMFRDMCSKFPIIHFSTHGFSLSYKSLQNDLKPASVDNLLSACGIGLANCNCNLYNPNFNPRYYDGILSAREISKCDLSGAELVVTSACNTAVGSITGDGNYAVERGLKAAGAKAVVVTLWSVSDESPVPFFECFYRELAIGKSLHTAFKNAREYVRTYVPSEHEGDYDGELNSTYDSPYHYNPFILIDALE